MGNEGKHRKKVGEDGRQREHVARRKMEEKEGVEVEILDTAVIA